MRPGLEAFLKIFACVTLIVGSIMIVTIYKDVSALVIVFSIVAIFSIVTCAIVCENYSNTPLQKPSEQITPTFYESMGSYNT